jgi:hypothetical protein
MDRPIRQVGERTSESASIRHLPTAGDAAVLIVLLLNSTVIAEILSPGAFRAFFNGFTSLSTDPRHLQQISSHATRWS